MFERDALFAIGGAFEWSETETWLLIYQMEFWLIRRERCQRDRYFPETPYA